MNQEYEGTPLVTELNEIVDLPKEELTLDSLQPTRKGTPPVIKFNTESKGKRSTSILK